MILEVLRLVESCGRIKTARRQGQRLSANIGYMMVRPRPPRSRLACRLAMSNERLVRPQRVLTIADECRELFAAAHHQPGRAATKLAARSLELTAVRLEAERGMRWGEVENFDDASMWRVPLGRG